MSTARASTVRAYRLVKKKWAHTAFDGEGAKRFGGRWNSKGRRCVYLAGSESLAILEIMVHLEDYRLLGEYALFALELPRRAIMQLDAAALPGSWREDPAPIETAALGDAWLASNESAVLAVPSVIVPRELNYLLNPQHPQLKEIVSEPQELAFMPDTRLT